LKCFFQMPTSTKMFVEQSHLTMPPSVWLHINGVSLTTDIHPYQPPIHSYDYRTKHLQSPVQPPTPPLISSPAVVPYSITMIDGPFSNNNNTNKQYQKWENADLPKKLFMDRQIKKAKSLPGLIKYIQKIIKFFYLFIYFRGTALSRHTPLQSSTFTSPAPLNLSTNIQDDHLPIATVDNDDDSLPLPPTNEHHHEPRRPRVYFADFNKVQFIEDNNEISPYHQTSVNSTHHRHRRRASKKTSNTNGTNYISPSIQQPQTLEISSRPLSRQLYPQIGQELSIKKQQIFNSPRVHSSRSAHLPDILNQSLPIEPSSNENSNGKYVLQREKHLLRLPKPASDTPVYSSLDISSDNTRHDNNHSSSIKDSHNHTYEPEPIESSTGMLLHVSSSISSSSTHRQRPSLRTISLRQQFISPIKLKTTNVTPITTINQQQQINNSVLNARRSASLKHSTLRMHNDNDDLHPNKPLLAFENRPMTGTGSVKKLKRSDIIHVNSKTPLVANTANDFHETSRHSHKTHPYESHPERFQNLLTIVRPPYATNSGVSSNIPSVLSNDSSIPTTNHIPTTGTIRSTRGTSARGTLDYHPTLNTITI
jgi:hypothetical protein